MSEDTLLPFDLPSVARKTVSVGLDGGQLSSDAGVLVLRGVEPVLFTVVMNSPSSAAFQNLMCHMTEVPGNVEVAMSTRSVWFRRRRS
jgi:hypothetical protein